MLLIYFILCYLILITTAVFNKVLIDSAIFKQQKWHKYQLVQWIVIYLSLTTEYMLINRIPEGLLALFSFWLQYAFLYDGILNKLRGFSWSYDDYNGIGVGEDYTIPYPIRRNLFVGGFIFSLLLIIFRG